MNNLDYGVIGNCKTAALVSKYGSIDWCCMPDFDSSSVFAKLLDKNIGGSFGFKLESAYSIAQSYIENTNLLCTRFSHKNDVFEVIDFMPRYKDDEVNETHCPPDVIRYFKHVSGNPTFRMHYDPKLGYAKYPSETVLDEDYIKTYVFSDHGDQETYDSIYLYTDFNRNDVVEGNEIVLKQDAFVLISNHQKLLKQTISLQYLKMHRTEGYWLNWTNSLTHYKKNQAQITRSALVLKLLTYDKTGAVLAAITTSLPEKIGEERNWDYRYCWIRDGSMVVSVMQQLGSSHTVKGFIKFLLDIIPKKDEKIQIMYGINRQKKLTEIELDHLDGYEGSKPVRVGNAAYVQKQNDIYGVLMDVILQHFTLLRTSVETSEYLWTITRSIVRIVQESWTLPDKGIWEIREEEKHFTFSKVLCWVAIDRAASIARLIGKERYAEQWEQLADEIKENVHAYAWNKKVQSFTQFYGSDDQDASNLLMETYGFIDAKDEKYRLTVKATEKELCYKGLMYRYKNADDFGTPGSSFTICTFWLIRSLCAIGEVEKAQKMFDEVLSYSNHLGLFSEGIDFDTKRLQGNFPQAYSHLALVETAITLSKGDVTKEENILSAIKED